MKRLRDARRDAGLTLLKAARAVGVSVSYLSDVEHGRRRLSQLRICGLCRVYGCSPVLILDQDLRAHSSIPLSVEAGMAIASTIFGEYERFMVNGVATADALMGVFHLKRVEG